LLGNLSSNLLYFLFLSFCIFITKIITLQVNVMRLVKSRKIPSRPSIQP